MRELPYATRAWTVPHAKKSRRKPKPGATQEETATRGGGDDAGSEAAELPRHALVIDTETTLDTSQRLLFGVYRYLFRRNATPLVQAGWDCLAEGLIYADDLPERDREAFEFLQAYARDNLAHVDLGTTAPAEPNWVLGLHSRTEFAMRWWHHVGVPHAARKHPCAFVFFNAPFDISRLASGWAPARGDMFGGFSFKVMATADGAEVAFKPRVAIKNIDAKRAIKKNRATDTGQRRVAAFAGHYLDLRTAAFALTATGHSLDSACKAYDLKGKTTPTLGVVNREAVEYCRNDVRATADLFGKVVEDFETHPISLQLTKAYSPASISKAYLQAMGIRPLLKPGGAAEATEPWVLGAAMSAFYGGRAECVIRRTPLPVQVVDFTSMYPSVNALMGSWDLITADRIEVINSPANTARLQQFLNHVDAETMFDLQSWPHLLSLVQIKPDRDLLPVRAEYHPENWAIGINYFTNTEALWFTLADVIASIILTGKIPTILDAITLAPHGRANDLRPVKLRGETAIDPTREDFFTRVIEERLRRKEQYGENDDVAASLKIIANAGGYGIFAELNPDPHKGRVTAYAGDVDRVPFEVTTARPEEPGTYTYPPLAACITGAARLMLALLEHEVTVRGGDWMFCDTDSMAIVTTETGGELYECPGGAHLLHDERAAVRALSDDDVKEICAKFNRLNPYDTDVVEQLLKKEKRGRCIAISAKRYAIYECDSEGSVVILKASEHGLGHLLNPDDPDEKEAQKDETGARPWIREVWAAIITSVETGERIQLPEWGDLPAHGRSGISSTRLIRPFEESNTSLPYADQVKPANFMLTATLDSIYRPQGVDPTLMRLIAPYNKFAQADTAWRNLHDPAAELTVTTDRTLADSGAIVIKTYGGVVRDHALHPESKFLDANGEPCLLGTVGRLQRGHVIGTLHARIGKEANQLHEIEAGITDPLEVTAIYDDGLRDYVMTHELPELLDHYGVVKLAEHLGYDRSTVRRVREGEQKPRPKFLRRTHELAADLDNLSHSPHTTD